MNMWSISVPIFSNMKVALLPIIVLNRWVVSASMKRFSRAFSSLSVAAMLLSIASW